MIEINHVKCCNKFYASPTSWVTNLPTLWKIKSKVTSIQDKFRWFNNGESREGRGGRVIRGHDREWLTGYARPLGQTNSCMAELWALRDGLMLAKELGLNNLIIELDALSVVLLMNNSTSNMLMEPLLTDCRNLLKAIPNKRVVYAYQEANQCADALAKLGATSLTSFVVFWTPPPVVDGILAHDKAKVFCNRIVNS